MVLCSMLKILCIVAIALCMEANLGMCTSCAENEIMAMYCSQKVPGRNETPCLSNLTYTTFCAEDLKKEKETDQRKLHVQLFDLKRNENTYPREEQKDDCPDIRRPYGTEMICKERQDLAYCNISCIPGMFIESEGNGLIHIQCSKSTSYKWIKVDRSPLKESDLPMCTNLICPKTLSVVLSFDDKRKTYLKFRKFSSSSDNCNITVSKKSESSNMLANINFHISDELKAQCTKQLEEFIKSKGGRSPPMPLILGYHCIEEMRRNILLTTNTQATKSVEEKESTVCIEGQIPISGSCTPCHPGYMWNDEECQYCEPGYYQNKAGQVKCKQCPPFKTSKPGTRSINDCTNIPKECDDESCLSGVLSGGFSGFFAGIATIIAAVIAHHKCGIGCKNKEGNGEARNDSTHRGNNGGSQYAISLLNESQVYSRINDDPPPIIYQNTPPPKPAPPPRTTNEEHLTKTSG